MTDPLLLVGGTIAGAFAPPLAYTWWVRRSERFHREPWGNLLRAFGWGATGAVVLALVLELALGVSPTAVGSEATALLVGAVLVAPLVEEFAKALGLRFVHDDHPEPEDGIIYGAAAGFGFAATENLLYAAGAYLELGLVGIAGSLVIRTISSALLHGTASGLLGYGVWKRRYFDAGTSTLLLAYLGAVALHAAFNLGASTALAVTFLASVIVAMVGFAWLRRKVRGLDVA